MTGKAPLRFSVPRPEAESIHHRVEIRRLFQEGDSTKKSMLRFIFSLVAKLTV